MVSRATLSARDLKKAVCSLVAVEESPLGWLVTTPVAYHTGDCISVAVTQSGADVVVHDASASTMLISAEGTVVGKDLDARFSGAVARYDCKYQRGRVTRTSSVEDVATNIMLVANASRAVADYTLELKRQSESHFRYAVTEKLRKLAGARLRENETFYGKSGRPYRVSNVILDDSQKSPLAFILPLSTRNSVATQFRELFDLHASWPGVHNESVYNDESDFRPDEDGWVLSQVGGVIPFSRLEHDLPLGLGIRQ